MKIRKLKPHSLTYLLSIILGLMMFLVVLISFLRFAGGSIWAALFLSFVSTAGLSVFLAWVDVQEHEEDREEKNKKLKANMRRQM
ncbi:MAG: hypothetical protein R3A80_06440 [Bdellovibrionota bacterium]